jgi:uncharacterized Rmd1/YagE family protein
MKLPIRHKDKLQHNPKFLRLSSYCTAYAYDMDKLLEALREDGYQPNVYDDVIHIQKQIIEDKHGGDIFYFPYGCIIMWGFTTEAAYKELRYLSQFQIKPLSRDYQDILNYKYGVVDNLKIHEEEDLVVLTKSNEILVKLSFSYALSQSAKLLVVEESGIDTLQRSQYLIDELIQSGKISISHNKLTKKIGMLFAERNTINMHADILDTPEFFWKRPKYLPIYKLSADFMDITTRIEIVNRRSNIVHELFYVLSMELQHKHSSRLEWIIIVLITIEVIISIGTIVGNYLGYF